MFPEEALLYFAVVFAGSAFGIPFGSWLNSKLLTHTWKQELKQTRKEISETKEYQEATQLVNKLSTLIDKATSLLESPEARNFIANTTKLLQQLTATPKGHSLINLPDDPTENPEKKGFYTAYKEDLE